MKTVIKRGDVVFATGVFLVRDENANGGWVVQSFDDDIYFNGDVVNNTESEDGLSVEYYTEKNECGIEASDVYQVANDINIKLTEDEVNEVLLSYPSEQAEDPTATWNLVVEKIIYDIKN